MVIEAVLSLPTRQLATMDSNLVLLLGIGGLTAVLAPAANPSSAAGSSKGFVDDWLGRGDVTRYQALALSVVAAIAILFAFFNTLTVPAIPQSILGLIAASHGTYLGTKVVKTGALEKEAAATGTP
jgi:hypothetical protein